MKLVRYGDAGQKPGLIDADGQLRDLSDQIEDINGAALSKDSLAKLSALDTASLPVVDGSPGWGLCCRYRKIHVYRPELLTLLNRPLFLNILFCSPSHICCGGQMTQSCCRADQPIQTGKLSWVW